MSKRVTLSTELLPWTIGPFHQSLPSPMLLNILSDGEVISSVGVESGLGHRGLERASEKHKWANLFVYADRVDPECAAFYELATALAVEEVGEIAVPDRAQDIRVILCELNRVSSHLGYIARMARVVGAETVFHYIVRDRERLLDLFELLTGSRFSFNFLRFGGTSIDVTEGFLERVLEACELMRVRLKEYNDLFTFNQAFIRRTAGIGVIAAADAENYALSGPNLRASGFSTDLRKAIRYSRYSHVDFNVPVGKGHSGVRGDCHDRFLVRLYEINESLEILRQLAHGISPGEYLNEAFKSQDPLKISVQRGEAYSRIEGSRGLIGCYVVSDGEDHPARVQYATPSRSAVALLPVLLEGALVEDLPIIIASLDISLSEVDK